MARVGRVQQGQDGAFRMTIDKKYSSLPMLRRTARFLVPFWLTLLAAKISYLAAPTRAYPEDADKLGASVMGACGLLSVFIWYLAALGSKRERFHAVLAFNIVTPITLILNVLRIVQQQLQKDGRAEFEASAVTTLLQTYVPAVQQLGFKLAPAVEHTGLIVDGGLLMVGIPLICSLHLYISEIKDAKKAAQSERRSRKAL